MSSTVLGAGCSLVNKTSGGPQICGPEPIVGDMDLTLAW